MSMNAQYRKLFTVGMLRRDFAVRLCALLFAFTANTNAAIAPKSAIPSGAEVTITIGLPSTYRAVYGPTPNARSNCIGANQTRTRLCARYVFGNDFQLLDWLENGRIDGAIVTPLTLKVLHTSGPQPFALHFVLARFDAFANRNLASYHLGLSAKHNSALSTDPLARYHSHLEALMTGNSAPAFKVYIDSHLSPALGLLLTSSGDWLRAQSPSPEQSNQLWRRLLARIVFALPHPEIQAGTVFNVRVTESCASSKIQCLTETPVRDYLLLRSAAIPESFLPRFRVLQNDDPAAIRETYRNVVPDYLPTPNHDEPSATSLRTFIKDNFTPHQIGSQVRRYFRFTIPELVHLLRPRADDDREIDVALVLTGGGVKAAYQTRLVDHLYKEPYLTNVVTDHSAETTSDTSPLRVKYVIGTSGGALLGLFVAAIEKSGDPRFSKLLWTNEKTQEIITFTDAFPPIDMLRWLSALGSLLVFSAFAIGLYKCPWVRKRLGIEDPSDPETNTTKNSLPADNGGRFLRFSAVWITFLALTPYMIYYVNGEALAEHIPELQGFFYAVFTLIAIYTDNHIIRAERSSQLEQNDDEKTLKTYVLKTYLMWSLLVGGLLLTVLSVAHRRWDFFNSLNLNVDKTWAWLERVISWKITTNAFTFCLGLLLLAFFIQRWYFDRSQHFRPLLAEEGDVKGAWLVLLLMPLVSIGGIYILYKMRIVSMLELTWSYWIAGLLVASVTVLLIFVFAIGKRSPAGFKRFLVPRLGFLMSRHPTKWGLHLNRHTRIFIFFAIAWGWWNIVVAPGMYGNDNPQEYIDRTFDRVTRAQGRPTSTTSDTGGQSTALQTFFVAPATSLETKSERYFLFNPSAQTHGDDGNIIDYRHQLAISSDPRWTQFSSKEQTKEMLTQIAFASGSPFPVFPAHKISIGDEYEWLVDGGYAHNTPIEAAKTLGADRLLVIYSSPLNIETSEPAGLLQRLVGKMAQNLPRLIPYLYERSQIEDILSAEELLVAVLAPTGGEESKDWPLLTDFRQRVVKRMFREADQDLVRRIGTIQNWGLPEAM